MAFLDDFEVPQRELLERSAETLALDRGAFLLKRGDPGGDLYVVLEGTLEVVDTRRTPEVIVATIEAGAIVGELAFVDDSPRSADVRATTSVRVLRWGRQDMRLLLQRHPELASRFFETIARHAARRLRAVNSVVSATRAVDASLAEGAQHALHHARSLIESTKTAMLEADARLRQAPDDDVAVARVVDALNLLEAGVDQLFSAHQDAHEQRPAAELLSRELTPWLVRSGLAERAIRRPQGLVATAEILAHVFVSQPLGDGRLGEVLDAWMLARPTLAALRDYRKPMIEAVAAHLPRHRNRRALVVSAGTGSLLAQLVLRVATLPTVVTVVDQSRDALAYLDAVVAPGPKGVDIHTVQEDLAQFALGRMRHTFQPQDAILLHGVLEYMPDRVAVGLLQNVARMLTQDGAVIAFALSPSPDRHLLDRLLEWPTLRRSEERLHTLFAAAGLSAQPVNPGAHQFAAPGLLAIGAARLLASP